MLNRDIDDDMLLLLLDKAAEAGAKRALEKIGLHDDDAVTDVRELRGLLDTWREAKKTVGVTIAKVITTTILATLAAGFMLNFGIMKK